MGPSSAGAAAVGASMLPKPSSASQGLCELPPDDYAAAYVLRVTANADSLAEPSTPGPQHRLATYGTLGPGRPNHPSALELEGAVVARLRAWAACRCWLGADLGSPPSCSILRERTSTSRCSSLSDLLDHWDRLDRLEGAGHARVVATCASMTVCWEVQRMASQAGSEQNRRGDTHPTTVPHRIGASPNALTWLGRPIPERLSCSTPNALPRRRLVGGPDGHLRCR